MQKTDLKRNPQAQDGSIIPYYMKNADPKSSTVEPWRYNDITQWGTYKTIVKTSSDSDPFKMATDGTIPEEYDTVYQILSTKRFLLTRSCLAFASIVPTMS